MVINMKKRIQYVCCAGLLLSLIFTTVSSAAPNVQVSTQLFKLLETKDLSVRYTTLMLLSHTMITDQVYEDLIKFANQENDPVLKLTTYYVLAKRTQETKITKQFIDSYPAGEPQRKISNYHWKHSQYIGDETVSSPLQAYLAYHADTDDLALEKLVSGYHFSDSTEELSSRIAELYKKAPNRIKPLLKKFKIDETVIKKISEK